MSENKNFLQELQSLKYEIELINTVYTHHHYELNLEIIECIKAAIDHAQDMINHCIELQLAIMKDDRTKSFYKERDIENE